MSGKLFSRQALKIICLCVTWYSFSSTNNVLSKQILSVFPHPMTLCMVQLTIVNVLLGPTLALLRVPPAPHFTRQFFIRRLTPLAAGKLLATLSTQMSVLKVAVSYTHTVKAITPIFTVMLSLIILGESYSLKVYLSLVPIVMGVVIATVTELSFDAVGMLAAIFATLTFALQNIYSKKFMKDISIHHLRLLMILSQLGFVFLYPVWLYIDVWQLFNDIDKVQCVSWLMFALPANALLTFGQNIVAFSMISAVSPVSYSVANATKRIVVISASLLMLRNPVTVSNVCGMVIAILGVALYNKFKYESHKKKDSLVVLPTSAK